MIVAVSPAVKKLFNVSSTNYSTLYKRFRRTDVTISSKSPSFYVSPLLNSPLSRGELTYGFVPRIPYGFVPRILYSGSSLKFTSFFSSNSRYLIRAARHFVTLPQMRSSTFRDSSAFTNFSPVICSYSSMYLSVMLLTISGVISGTV